MARATAFLVVFMMAAALLVIAPPSSAQSEDLEKRVDELTKQVAALQRQVKALQAQVRASATQRPAAAPSAQPAGRAEAVALYDKIDALLAEGKIDEAHGALTAFNEKYAGTPTAAWTRSLTRELAVVGKPAPEDWSIEKWYQGQDDLSLDGDQMTVVVFWESWCPHCKNEVPKLQNVYNQYRDKGLQMLGVTRLTRTATEESVKSFIDEKDVSYPMAKETGALAEYFSVKGIPAAAVVKGGKIVWRGHPTRLTDELLQSWL